MASQKIITVFGATGKQGSSVINTVLSNPAVSAKYALRGVTRNRQSASSKSLTSRGVEMVEADQFDPASIRSAVQGSYGVFSNTDYWTLLDKDKEIEQGKNIFRSCKEANVHHFIYSTLPHISKLSNGKYTNVAHFDSKAIVAEYIEANKDGMVVSYFMPAMYMENIKLVSQEVNGSVLLSLPYPDPDLPWPLIAPGLDTGKWVVGLFEAGDVVDGVAVQGVSAWTTPNEVAKAVAQNTGKDARFNTVDANTYRQYLPANIRAEMGEMMEWIGESSYFGRGTEKKQADSNQWIFGGAELTSVETFIESDF